MAENLRKKGGKSGTDESPKLGAYAVEQMDGGMDGIDDGMCLRSEGPSATSRSGRQ
jgi:hypothetical protein